MLYPRAIGFTEAAFGSCVFDARRVRMTKHQLLHRFQLDGFYLIDASDHPMPEGADVGTKRQVIREMLPSLKRKVLSLCSHDDVPIILIGSLSYSMCTEAFRHVGLNVLNDEMINHPSRGGQKRFRTS